MVDFAVLSDNDELEWVLGWADVDRKWAFDGDAFAVACEILFIRLGIDLNKLFLTENKMRGYKFKYRNMMCKFDFLHNLIIQEYKHILGHVLSEEGEVVAKPSDRFQLMLETHQSREFLLVAVDLVNELVGQNQAVLLVKVVVFAFL